MDRRSLEQTSCGEGDGGEPASDSEPRSRPPAIAASSDLPGTILSIQILRFVAALGVVIFHAHLLLARKLPGHVLDRVDHAFAVGASGVHIFFVISGFVMVYTSYRSHLSSSGFLKRRLIRIYPIYWIVGALYVLAHQMMGNPYELSLGQLGGAALLLPGYSSLVIGPGWTLSYEMYFYLCFALALLAGVRAGLTLLTAFYALSVVAGMWFHPTNAFTKVATNSLLVEFLAGAWLAVVFLRGRVVSRRVGAALILVSAAIFASGFWFPYESLPSIVSWGVPALMLVAGSLAFESRLEGGVGRQVAKLGDSSYLLYLSLVLVLDLMIATPLVLLNVDARAVTLLSLPLSIACVVIAAVGYRVVERPLLLAMKRLFLRRPKSSLAPSVALS